MSSAPVAKPGEPSPDEPSSEERPGAVARVTGGVGHRWQRAQDEHRWLRHVVEAFGLLQRNHGNQYAAAITFFSFLALFPMVLLAVAITGFVLRAHPAAEQSLYAQITSNVPGQFGTTITDALQKAIDKRAGVGIVGLVGVLLTGLGWVGNLREAINAVWGRPLEPANFVMARLKNLLVLGGLGLGAILSVGLTVVGTSLTDQILSALGLSSVPGATLVLKVLGIAVAVGGDMIIFWWLLVRLPQAETGPRVALRGALLAAVGFEILKIVGSFTIAHTANSPTAGPFASILGVLIWIQLVSRFLLFCCAWLATATVERTANTVPIAEPAAMADPAEAEPAHGVSPAAVGATLVGAGAVAGAVATWAVTRSRPADD